MSDYNFSVTIPNTVLIIGIMDAAMSVTVLLCFTLFSSKLPHLIFYIFFGLFFWLGIYLIIKTLNFKVIVKGDTITVFSTLKKTFSFTFSEIISAVRQTKNNKIKSERIVIKTISNKKLIVESSEISYKRFAKRIKLEVKSEYLIGFEQV